MIGYKAFEHDFTCRGFQYEVGKTYEIEGPIKLCERGFHFCEKISDCFRYYDEHGTRFAKVEALGNVILSADGIKCVTNKIKIIEEISREKAVRMSNSGNRNSGSRNSGDCNFGGSNSGDKNSGYYNSGDWNAGNRNTGNRNFGYYNSGSCNSGNWNSGNWNSGYYNSGSCNSGNWNSGNWNSGYYNSGDWNKSSQNNGCFMSVKPVIMMFNKPTSWTFEDWRGSKAYDVMENCPIDYIDTEWISLRKMTDDEKTLYPDYRLPGGYLKIIKHKADRQAWWDGLPAVNKQTVMNLPNFDADVFYECTGIRVKTEGE